MHAAAEVLAVACTAGEQGAGAEACHVAVAGAAAWRADGAGGPSCDAAASPPAQTDGVQSAPCGGGAYWGEAPAAAWWADEGTQTADQGKGTATLS